MSRLPDPVAESLTRGRRVLNASRETMPATLQAEVAMSPTDREPEPLA
jgi:hypothetical protein